MEPWPLALSGNNVRDRQSWYLINFNSSKISYLLVCLFSFLTTFFFIYINISEIRKKKKSINYYRVVYVFDPFFFIYIHSTEEIKRPDRLVFPHTNHDFRLFLCNLLSIAGLMAMLKPRAWTVCSYSNFINLLPEMEAPPFHGTRRAASILVHSNMNFTHLFFHRTVVPLSVLQPFVPPI